MIKRSVLRLGQLWRDSGYAGALLAGVIADALGMTVAIASIGVVTLLSGIIGDRRHRDHEGDPARTAGMIL